MATWRTLMASMPACRPADWEGHLPLREIALVAQLDAESGGGSRG
jgi:hypothetical protein